jgi:ribosomal protein L7/L12
MLQVADIKMSLQEIVEKISSLSMMDLADLVKQLKEKFGLDK